MWTIFDSTLRRQHKKRPHKTHGSMNESQKGTNQGFFFFFFLVVYSVAAKTSKNLEQSPILKRGRGGGGRSNQSAEEDSRWLEDKK